MSKIYNTYSEADISSTMMQEWREVGAYLENFFDEKKQEKSFDVVSVERINQFKFNTFFQYDNVSAFFYCGHYGGNGIPLGKDFIALDALIINKFIQQKHLRFISLNSCNNIELCEKIINEAVKKNHPLLILGTNEIIESDVAHKFMIQFMLELTSGKLLKHAFETAKAVIGDEESSKWEFFRTDDDLLKMTFWELLQYEAFHPDFMNFYSIIPRKGKYQEYLKALERNNMKEISFNVHSPKHRNSTKELWGIFIENNGDSEELAKIFQTLIADDDGLPFFYFEDSEYLNRKNFFSSEEIFHSVIGDEIRYGNQVNEFIKEIENRVQFTDHFQIERIIAKKNPFIHKIEERIYNTRVIQLFSFETEDESSYYFLLNSFISRQKNQRTNKKNVILNGDLGVDEIRQDLVERKLLKFDSENSIYSLGVNLLNDQPLCLNMFFSYKSEKEVIEEFYKFLVSESANINKTKQITIFTPTNLSREIEGTVLINPEVNIHTTVKSILDYADEEDARQNRRIDLLKPKKGVRDLKYFTPHTESNNVAEIWRVIIDSLASGNKFSQKILTVTNIKDQFFNQPND